MIDNGQRKEKKKQEKKKKRKKKNVAVKTENKVTKGGESLKFSEKGGGVVIALHCIGLKWLLFLFCDMTPLSLSIRSIAVDHIVILQSG